jgi:hypothetical protein
VYTHLDDSEDENFVYDEHAFDDDEHYIDDDDDDEPTPIRSSSQHAAF